MPKNRYFTLALIVISMLGYQANAKLKKWTLPECVEYALEHNLSIRQAQFTTDLSIIDVNQSKTNVLPSINFGAQQAMNFGRNIDPLTNQFTNTQINSLNGSLNANLTLFSGFSQLNRIKQNKYALMADQSNLEKVKNDISLNVVTAYLQVLYAIELKAINQKQVELSLQQVDRAEKNNSLGLITEGDVLGIKAQLAQDELSLTNANAQLSLAYLNLRQLMDLPNEEAFDILIPNLDVNKFTVMSAESVYESALSTQPDIANADFRVNAAKYGLHAAKGAYAPRIAMGASLFSGYSSGRKQVDNITTNGFDTIGFTQATLDPVLTPNFEFETSTQSYQSQFKDNFNQSINFSVQIPIFNSFQNMRNVKRAKINYHSAKLNADLARNNLNKTVTQAVNDAQAAQNRYMSSELSLNANRESLNYATQKFNVGLINSIEYSQTKNTLARAEYEFLQSKYDLIFKRKVVDFYLGNPLTF
jgi:outer membrane protein